ncbi:glycosyl transferase [Sedimentisphaera salicampi]|uniref:Glycosyltransferase n=1 Tax=Sedimentisphaera salicampi TaxID=1941349 RepID=A0A1W6LM62_9BACT|nr:glycosyl transferase [Sedimentisphaera salicampi]ARN56834.1 hypothetical protein STSP1_01226 [Sedimentisphaera salicampi]
MTPKEPVNIITLKWGNLYGYEYVNRLQKAVERNLSIKHNFICFTDDKTGLNNSIQPYPIPEIDLPPQPKVTGWRKLCLFRPDLPIEGICLFLDLDILILNSIDKFFDYGEDDQIPIIHNWIEPYKTILRKRPEIGNSSVFRFEANKCTFVYEQFLREKEWALENFRPPQTYLTHCIRPKMIYWPEQWVRSFKRHCRPVFPLNLLLTPKIPENASILAFHGKPDPHEALAGYRGRKLNHFSRPAKWIEDYWH